MKIVKVFLASSEELLEDRIAIGDLVRRLDQIYEQRGVRIRLFKWEDYDAAYNGIPKQCEYNDKIKDSDIFIALFHKKSGQFTRKEFEIAIQEFKRRHFPKVYVYCKLIRECEEETSELVDFKHLLVNELGYYWCRYTNRDEMYFQLVMQLNLFEASTVTDLSLNDGILLLEGSPIAQMDSLSFVANNEDYKRIRDELSSLPIRIHKLHHLVEQYPSNAFLKQELQTSQNHFNKLKRELEASLQSMLETEKRITEILLSQISDRHRRAIDAFERGNIVEANLLLDEIARDMSIHIKQWEQQTNIVHMDIDAAHLQAQMILSDMSVPSDIRTPRVKDKFAHTVYWAKQTHYDDEKYFNLLSDYVRFLYTYAMDSSYYEEANNNAEALVSFCKMKFGVDDLRTASAYGIASRVYLASNNLIDALEAQVNVKNIYENVLCANHPLIAKAYNDYGKIVRAIGNYKLAVDYFECAIRLSKESFRFNNLDLATFYSNLSYAYYVVGKINEALSFVERSIAIKKEIFGEMDRKLTVDYDTIGLVYLSIGNYEKSLQYLEKSRRINEKEFGYFNARTATSYYNLGLFYTKQRNFSEARHYLEKSLSIRLDVLGSFVLEIGFSYLALAELALTEQDYDSAPGYVDKALDISNACLNSLLEGSCCYVLGKCEFEVGQYSLAQTHFEMCAFTYKKLIGDDSPYFLDVSTRLQECKLMQSS